MISKCEQHDEKDSLNTNSDRASSFIIENNNNKSTETLSGWTCAFKILLKVTYSSPIKVIVHFRFILKFHLKAVALLSMCDFS